MIQSSLHIDEELDSLFGSPPPSPARGRSPSQETFTAGEEVGPRVAIPSTGVATKNVGTIALPGSHMSCAELPADLPAPSLSLPRPTSSHDSLSATPHSIAGTPTSAHTSIRTSRSSTRSVSSRASSATSVIPFTSTSTRKRKTQKAKSATPAPPVPPITLPGPNEPTPPNFLRSQSSLLGLAGLVGSVKPAQLRTHVPQPAPVQPPSSHSPRGSTPTNPIVLDDDQDAPRVGKKNYSQVSQHMDQLNPEVLRSNILKSLGQEKNIFPVLESLIKVLGGEPPQAPANLPSQSFARPYGHGIFNAQPPPIPPLSAPGTSTTPAVPPPKRRKLKHVPAGAVDWDVPFPFAVGEGPEAYRDTWTQSRAKQLVTQLLELVQGAAKRAAIKTAKSRRKTTGGRTGTQSCQSSRSTSVETQIGQTSSTQVNVGESLSYTSPGPEDAVAGTPDDDVPMEILDGLLGSLGAPSMIGSSRIPGPKESVNSEGVTEDGGSAVACDYAAFEEWLSQLQQFVPLESSASTPDSDWGSRLSVPLDSYSGTAPSIHVPHTIQDEAIDPALLALSQQAGSQSQSPTSHPATLASGDIPQMLDISLIPPVLTHSPRTSLSSLTEPLTPLSEAFVDVPTSAMAHPDLVRDLPPHQHVGKDHHARGQARMSSSSTEPTEPLCITAAEKGKGRVDASVTSTTPSASSRSTPSVVSTSTRALDKQAILERARERRRELVAEIERAKKELWEMSIENAVLVHFTRNASL